MIFFGIVFAFVVIQRLVELSIAKRNEAALKRAGAYEVGSSHYKWMVSIHVCFLLSLLLEVVFFHPKPAVWFWIPLFFFIGAQIVRVWVIRSLGRFWNTKIIILPNIEVVTKGPYKHLRHPNYLVVTIEICMLPLLFQAYITAIVFTLLNAIILSIRIPIEEKALSAATNYSK
ncbi:MAG: isoprenylcysteine carboxyl methyltransferase [Bacilli bacterium]|nr:isoprenylcysteine carboxyl methyltransferase [Bacilli bacterium]